MKNKKLLYGLLGIGAIAGFYFYNKNKMPKDLGKRKGMLAIEPEPKGQIMCIKAPCN